ncbi:MAG: Sun protein [Deltaproteobacteria bacterium]|nr:Sun protein [Deltaproteobacteria bacterium]
MVAPARQIATRVLHRVARDDAWAAPTLDAELRRGSVSRVDAALATQIVYGTLRTARDLDASLARHARRTLKVDSWTHAALLGAAYQLLHLERVPSHAVVNDAVELVRMKRGKRVAGFANAILRKVAADRPDVPEPPSSVAIPSWLRDALGSSIGAEHTDDLLRVGREPPSIDLRVRTDIEREAIAESIGVVHPAAVIALTELSPHGLRVSGAGDPRALPGYEKGAFAVQEEGAQLIGSLLQARPGERVLDACAGRGGKTAQLIECVGESGSVVATDLHEHRLEQISAELIRLRLDPAGLETACVDWTVGKGTVRGDFDRVLIDAPCTGIGTLRRRPEILLRTGRKDAARMGETQRRILENAGSLVRPGGTLLYAVCSPLSDEGPAVVESVDLPGFDLQVGRASHLKSLYFGSDGGLDVGPWVQGAGPWADAYQVYMWVNVG